MPRDRPAPVAGHREVGTQFSGALGVAVAHSSHPTVLVQQPGDLGLHSQGERRLGLRGLGEQVQQVPLRHHRNVGVRLATQPAEIDHRDVAPGHVKADLMDLTVRQRRETLPEPELIE